jgi:DNA transformation protein and related proteins
MSALTTLRNIGPRSAYFLGAVGIQTVEDLQEIGIVAAYLLAKKVFPEQVNLNLLYVLQGAFLDLAWNQLPLPLKEQLRLQVGETDSAPDH